MIWTAHWTDANMSSLPPLNLPPFRSMPGVPFVCTIPRSLGIITGLRIVAGRVIADTSAGVPFIVPVPRQTARSAA